jgi:hypothetical protein
MDLFNAAIPKPLDFDHPTSCSISCGWLSAEPSRHWNEPSSEPTRPCFSERVTSTPLISSEVIKKAKDRLLRRHTILAERSIVEDPIPEGFITLPEALQRIADCVSEAHVESAKLDFQANVTRRGECAIAMPESPKSEGADSETYTRPSQDALLHWDKRNFAVAKLTLALQTGAISAMVRSPESGGKFRLTPADWHFEPFREQIIRGGVIPPFASRGFECPVEERFSSRRSILKNG